MRTPTLVSGLLALTFPLQLLASNPPAVAVDMMRHNLAMLTDALNS